MTRTLHSGCFLIVEGETSDPRAYRRFIDAEACRIIAAPGKALALEALEILEEDDFAGVAAVVDADLWRLEGGAPASPNVFITDGHDLEAMILKSPALEKLLAEFGSPAKLQSFTEGGTPNVRKVLLDLARPLGYLRWVSAQEGLSLTFADISFGRFIHPTTLELDITKMVRAVKHKSGRHELGDEELHKAICEIEDINDHDPWDVCCGHDMVSILSLGLRRALGSNNAVDVRPELLHKSLRLAYEADYFVETDLFRSVVAWQDANHPFRILSPDLGSRP